MLGLLLCFYLCCRTTDKIQSTAVLSAVAAAAKAWQKFKGPEQNSDAEQVAEVSSANHPEQQHVCSSSAVAGSAPATRHASASVSQPSPSDALTDTAVGGRAYSTGSIHAVVQSLGASPSHAAGLQPTNSSGSSVIGGQPGYRVDFAQLEADAAAGGSSVAQQGGEEAYEGLDAEQQASAADLRARVAARMRR